ncbi:hypothetical protein AVEN_128882-1 [Araneus ventricosus]|uniref:Uncharacterized protein n=1 Tax=Araneus ventricosus TaxID=182803 RepID=A0A4Y2U906_ARAVE|nr:hypothetical protein AVEN_128882-1 [Araneus ventricosus]
MILVFLLSLAALPANSTLQQPSILTRQLSKLVQLHTFGIIAFSEKTMDTSDRGEALLGWNESCSFLNFTAFTRPDMIITESDMKSKMKSEAPDLNCLLGASVLEYCLGSFRYSMFGQFRQQKPHSCLDFPTGDCAPLVM